MTKIKIFFSTLNSKYYPNGDIKQILDDLINLGIKNIEISSGHKYEPYFWQKIYSYKNKVNIILHNFAPPENNNFIINLADFNSSIRKQSILSIKKKIKLTKLLGQDYYSFHSGFCAQNFSLLHKNTTKKADRQQLNQCYQYFQQSLKEIYTYAKLLNIKIGFENNVVIRKEKKKNFLMHYRAKEILETLNSFKKQKRLFLHLDIGHLNVSASTYGFDKINFIKQLKNKIYAIHLHDNNGLSDQHLPISQKTWILPYLKIFNNLKILTLETKGPLTKTQIYYYKNLLKKYYL